MKKQKTHILMLGEDDPKRELEFEVAFQLSLTVEQRYKRMKKLFSQTIDTIKKHDYPKTPAIISRT
ncbi:MAG: hypothetical protein A2V93_11780 [Ignavibacteria bacterium RBG_16_34_14]|nr:MAG: hypothetical protein A2V93_11780 [Ignavibacteria bacterium RBG_16_34_14]